MNSQDSDSARSAEGNELIPLPERSEGLREFKFSFELRNIAENKRVYSYQS